MTTMTVIEMLKELKQEIMDGEAHAAEPRDEAYNAGISYGDDVVRSFIRRIEDKELGIVSI